MNTTKAMVISERLLQQYVNDVAAEFDEHQEIIPVDSLGKDSSTMVSSSFPLEVFPEVIQNLIYDTKKALGFPLEYSACTILFAVSLAIGNNYKVIPIKGWIECGALWVAIVGRAGAAKSPVIKFLMKPFSNLEEAANQNYKREMAQYNALSKQEKENVDMPSPVRYFTQDVTPEALMQTLSNNTRGVGLKFDELSMWWENFNRYNNNVEGLYLSAWDGGCYKVDRMGRPSIEVSEMNIPIIGGTQPSKLGSLAGEGRDSSGLMARILFCFPDNIHKHKWNDFELEPIHAENWQNIIAKLLQFDPANQIHLTISDAAYPVITEWQHKNAEEVNGLNEGTLAEMYNKAERNCIRLALIFQMLNWAVGDEKNEQIGINAVKAAIATSEYFKAQAKKVCDYIFERGAFDMLKGNQRDFYNCLHSEFTRQNAVEIGKQYGVTGGTLNRMLKNKELFIRTSQGVYTKNL